MGDTTNGPTTALPGDYQALPDGSKCDEHADRPAVARVMGDVDSFGGEFFDMCEECLKQYREELKNEDTSGECEWCKKHSPKLRPRRDYEEGLAGRVYYVCDACVKKQEDQWAEEDNSLDDGSLDADYDDYDYDDDDDFKDQW
jgi:hypothetical protein